MNKGVVLYDDNRDLRESISNLVKTSDEFYLLAAFENCNQVEKDIIELRPDVILMDIDMPGVNGIEAVKKIRQFNRHTPVIMLTVFDDNKNVFDAICAGASGYLLKKNISEKLILAIHEVLDGGAPMSPNIAKMVIQSMQSVKGSDPYNLTLREREILSSLSRGNSYKMIAAELFISPETVRTHLKRIYEKLQVRSQTEAVSKAINERLI